jgi:phospholipase/carboxylesterase
MLLNKEIFHLVQKSNREDKSPLIVLLHGYGSNEKDLFSFKEFLPNDATIVSFRAPLELFQNMYAWYQIYFENNVKSFDEKSAFSSKDLIIEKIKQISKDYNCDDERITLIGFSQGAILGFSVALMNNNLIKNLVALSGYVEEKIIDFSSISFPNIYISHGINDNVIPHLDSKKTLQILNKNKINYDYYEFNQGHGVNMDNLNSFLKWIKDKY